MSEVIFSIMYLYRDKMCLEIWLISLNLAQFFEHCKLYLFNMYRTVVPRFFNQFIFKTGSYRPAATGWFALTIFTVKLTFLFCKLMEKTGFSNSHVPDDDVLKYVRVIIRASRHGYTCRSGQRGRKLAYCICWIKHWHQNYII